MARRVGMDGMEENGGGGEKERPGEGAGASVHEQWGVCKRERKTGNRSSFVSWW